METKINKKFEQHIEKYKELIKTAVLSQNIDNKSQNAIMEAVYSLDTFELNKDDFMKRKRLVTGVSMGERCIAKKANGEQCSRKKRCNCDFCGTHDKYQPHGIITPMSIEKTLKKCSITIVDVNGINYYMDDNKNIYNTCDILTNSMNPTIIGGVNEMGKIYFY